MLESSGELAACTHPLWHLQRSRTWEHTPIGIFWNKAWGARLQLTQWVSNSLHLWIDAFTLTAPHYCWFCSQVRQDVYTHWYSVWTVRFKTATWIHASSESWVTISLPIVICWIVLCLNVKTCSLLTGCKPSILTFSSQHWPSNLICTAHYFLIGSDFVHLF